MSASRDLERLAAGPEPRSRVPVPKRGERCPRCHSGARDRACLLCRPDLVPAANIVACPICERPVGAQCVVLSPGGYQCTVPAPHLLRQDAAAERLAEMDAAGGGVGYVITRPDGSREYVPAERVTVYGKKT